MTDEEFEYQLNFCYNFLFELIAYKELTKEQMKSCLNLIYEIDKELRRV